LIVREGVTEHYVNFISLRWSCTSCADSDLHNEMSVCNICKPLFYKENQSELDFKRKKKWSSYTSDDPIEEFVDWLLTAFETKYPIIIYSHNGGRSKIFKYF
jgi:hypothetical protein